MARTTATNFSGALQFPYATTATDLFKKEDVQTLAVAVDQHDHTTGKGVTVPISTNASLLTNGGFEIWQRGASGFGVNGAWCADQWQLIIPSGAANASKDTTNVDTGSLACLAFGTNSGASYLQQTLKTVDGAQIAGRTFAFSARLRTTTAGAAAVQVTDGVTTTQTSPYHTGNGAYQTLSTTITVGPTATILYVRVICAAAATVYVDNAMLVVGSQAADYAPLHPADDLARCLRYYERLDIASNGIALPGLAYVATGIMWAWPFKTLKAITPTITYATANQFAALNSTGNTITATAIGSFGITSDRATGSLTVTGGLVAGNASILGAATGGTPYIISEGNP